MRMEGVLLREIQGEWTTFVSFYDDVNTMHSSLHDTVLPHTFNLSHMTHALTVLMPYIGRWKTLTICTNFWAPMTTALKFLNTCFFIGGAPCLEELILVRANPHVLKYPIFQPARLRRPALLERPYSNKYPANIRMFPLLRVLILDGVMVHWRVFSRLLKSPSPLRHLVIRHLASDVCPDVRSLRCILRKCPNLVQLEINQAGPVQSRGEPLEWELDDRQPRLHKLVNLSISFTKVYEALEAIRIFGVPNVQHMEIRDASLLGNLLSDDIVAYMATGHFPISVHDNFLRHTPPFPSLNRLVLYIHMISFDEEARLMFPPLYRTLQCLEDLQIRYCSVFAITSLSPRAAMSLPTPPSLRPMHKSGAHESLLPCPALRKLVILNLTMSEVGDLSRTHGLLENILRARQDLSCNQIETIDLHSRDIDPDGQSCEPLEVFETVITIIPAEDDVQTGS
jgi:hypothetical protein